MDDIQEDLIEEIVMDQEIREMTNISIERIKDLATKNRNEISDKTNSRRSETVSLEQDLRMKDEEETLERINEIRQKRNRRLFSKRIWIPLVAILTLVVSVTATIHYNPVLKDIFGEFFPFKEQIQLIEKSMSAEGLTFTAEGAFIDKKSGLFIASFTKNDGTTFEEGSEVKQIQVNTKIPGSMGWSMQSKLSEDKKRLICILDISANQKLYGRKLTIEATDIRVWKNLSKISDIKLDQLKSLEIKQPWENYISATGLNQNLVEDFKEIKLDAFYIGNQGIELITSYYDQVNIEDQSTYIEIIDERTNQSYEPTYSDYYWSEKEALNKDYYVFEQFKKEDLPYLKLKVGNMYFENSLKGKWQVAFQLDENSQTKIERIRQKVESKGQKLTITKVEVSALGVTLEGYKGSRKLEALQEVYLKMKDGTKIDLVNTGMNTSIIKFNMY